jgi:hypothetical protein
LAHYRSRHRGGHRSVDAEARKLVSVFHPNLPPAARSAFDPLRTLVESN